MVLIFRKFWFDICIKRKVRKKYLGIDVDVSSLKLFEYIEKIEIKEYW